MSSHHIIREKQEPALLILGLSDFPDELLGQLLEWSPTLIVTDNTADTVDAFGIKLDVLVTNNDSGATLQSDVKYIIAENKIIDAAFKFLIDNNYPAVNIITDDLDLNDYLPYTPRINIVIFNQFQKIYPVTSGFTKWKPEAERIKLMSPVTGLITTGLQKTDDTHYTTITNGFISLEFNEPFMFIAEQIA